MRVLKSLLFGAALMIGGCATFVPVSEVDCDSLLIIDQAGKGRGGMVKNDRALAMFIEYFAALDGWKLDLGRLPEEMEYMVFFFKDGEEVHRLWIYEDRIFKLGYTTYTDLNDFNKFLSRFRKTEQTEIERELIIDDSLKNPIRIEETARSNK